MQLYDILVKDKNDEDISLVNYRGKVLLIVNTATHCGFTPQYTGLESLYKKFHERGFEILDFPCNQFGLQAPGSDDEIYSFCSSKFNISFKQFKKINVNGKKQTELYKFLKDKKTGVFGKAIKWNFTKFLGSLKILGLLDKIIYIKTPNLVERNGVFLCRNIYLITFMKVKLITSHIM